MPGDACCAEPERSPSRHYQRSKSCFRDRKAASAEVGELYQCVVEADVPFQTGLGVVELDDGHLCGCDGQNVLHPWCGSGRGFKDSKRFPEASTNEAFTRLSASSAVLPGLQLERCSPRPVTSPKVQFQPNTTEIKRTTGEKHNWRSILGSTEG